MSSTFWERSGITPGKAALVAGLAILLVAVVGYQVFSGAYGTTPSPAPQQQIASQTKFEPKRRGDATSNVRTFSALETEALPVEAWPEIPLDETLAHNPFATPEALIPKVPEPDDLIPFTQVSPQETDEHLPIDPAELQAHRERVRAIRDLMTQGASMVMTVGDGSRVAVVNGRTIRIGDTMHGMRVTEITSEGVVLEALSTDQKGEP